MGLDLMGDRGIRSLLVFRRIPLVDQREGKGTCLERQDPGLLAMKFFFPRAVTPTAPFSTDSISRQKSRSCKILLFQYTLDTMGSNGEGIKPAYGVWIQDS
jgi:hypothetical protein